uniref:Uncharacterized protein n=1 Tax=Cucumis melo TaxID=3656 RepID=A0A9I9EGM6_CUCME
MESKINERLIGRTWIICSESDSSPTTGRDTDRIPFGRINQTASISTTVREWPAMAKKSSSLSAALMILNSQKRERSNKECEEKQQSQTYLSRHECLGNDSEKGKKQQEDKN